MTESSGLREKEALKKRKKDTRRTGEKDDPHKILIRHPMRVLKTTLQRNEPASVYLG